MQPDALCEMQLPGVVEARMVVAVVLDAAIEVPTVAELGLVALGADVLHQHVRRDQLLPARVADVRDVPRFQWHLHIHTASERNEHTTY